MKSRVNLIIGEREKLIDELKKIGIKVYRSDANFILIKLKNAKCIQAELARKYNLVTREINDYLRITVGKPAENKKLINALIKIYE